MVEPSSEATRVTGATAQTGGFVQADGLTVQEDLGGLGSSRNVSKPETSVDPETGNIQTAGLTSAELEQKRTAEAAEMGQAAFGGAGLASSPNVPRPGTTIDPETGKPHTAGLTREELAKKRAAEAELSEAAATVTHAASTTALERDPSQDQTGLIRENSTNVLGSAPQKEEARKESTGSQNSRKLSDLSGREQAAIQLAAASSHRNDSQSDSVSARSSSPGQELPGGWGNTKPIPLPGSGPGAPTTLYEDVAEGLGIVGQAAFAAIPSPIKERIHAINDNEKTERRLSATALLGGVKAQTGKITSNITDTIQDTQRRVSENFGPNGAIRNQIKTFVEVAFENPKDALAAKFGFAHNNPDGQEVSIVPRVSMPTNEPMGAMPGEHSSGVGALPGTVDESAVAVLPEERINSEADQSIRFGEGPPDSLMQTAIAHTKGEAADASATHVSPSVTTTDRSLPGRSIAPIDTSPSDISVSKDELKAVNQSNQFPTSLTTHPSISLNKHGLAPPILSTCNAGVLHSPSTSLSGTAPSSVDNLSTPLGTSTASHSVLTVQNDLAPNTSHGYDRSTSAASVTAIAHGHEGNPLTKISGPQEDVVGKSPLSQSLVAGKQETHGKDTVSGERNNASGVDAGPLKHMDLTHKEASELTTHYTGSQNKKTLTPGNVQEGVGHPSTRGNSGTSREPGVYPDPEYTIQTVDESGSKGNKRGLKSGAKVEATSDAGDLLRNGSGSEAMSIKPVGAINDFAKADTSSHSPDNDKTVPDSNVKNHPSDSVGKPNGGPLTTGSATDALLASQTLNNTKPAIATANKGHAKTNSTSSGTTGKKLGFIKRLKGEIKSIGKKA
nr:hypothetical protein L203_00303 [Cryptococcus depauperatus CBS 7841]